MVKRVVLFFSIAVGLGIGAYLLAFGRPGTRSPEPVSAAASPPVEVGIVVVQPAEVPLPMEYAGRVAGFREVRHRGRGRGDAPAYDEHLQPADRGDGERVSAPSGTIRDDP
jgi:membrane fusion protein (multidrug efflux system)